MTHMSWGNPWMLLALLLPAAALWVVRRMNGAVRPPPPALRRVVLTRDDGVVPAGPEHVRGPVLLLSAIALGIIALARPQWGEHSEQSFSQSVEVMIALDLSRSMWTADMPGRRTRLAAAKDTIGRLLDGLKGETVGLILFAGTSFVQVPMSPDYQIIREFLPSLDPNYMPRGGSDFDRMLNSAAEGFGSEPGRDRYLIVLSDGESSTQGWETRVADLARRNIHVIGIGFGTEKGAPIPNQKGGYVTDQSGTIVISHLTPATLQGLADRTAGRYLAATEITTAAAARDLIRDTVETGRAGRAASTDASVGNDRFPWFLAPAVLLGLAGLVRELPRYVRPRQIRPARLMAFALLSSLLCASYARADADAVSDQALAHAATADPAQALRTLAARLGQSGYDGSDLELFVVASIQYGAAARAQGRLPIAGVIRDALDAAREGRRLAPRLASWEGFEEQLLSLMGPLPGGFREHDTRKSDEDEADDHKNDDPMAAGQKKAGRNGQQVKNDGPISKTDFTLGDLSADDNFAPQRSQAKKPAAPKSSQAARPAFHASSAEDPGLAQARRNSAAVVKADSPGRVHELLEGDTKLSRTPARNW